MADLLAGGQKSLSPWIQSTVYDHLLHKLRNKEDEPLEHRCRRPKVVQLIDIDLGGPTRNNNNNAEHRNYLLISDGKHSIVASYGLDKYHPPDAPPLTRGGVVRIHDWNVRSTSLGEEEEDNAESLLSTGATACLLQVPSHTIRRPPSIRNHPAIGQ